jgi:hypothetical protein
MNEGGEVSKSCLIPLTNTDMPNSSLTKYTFNRYTSPDREREKRFKKWPCSKQHLIDLVRANGVKIDILPPRIIPDYVPAPPVPKPKKVKPQSNKPKRRRCEKERTKE